MGGKYEILARNYKDVALGISLYTDNRLKAFFTWIKARLKYELVEFTIRK